MKIIFQKNKLYTNEDFFYEVQTNNKIEGIFLNVIATKDFNMVVINPELENELFIPNYTLSELEYLNLLTLQNTLSKLANTNKKIVINLLPINLYDETEQNLEIIKENAKKNIRIIKSIIDQYPKLNIYICSRIQRTIYLIQEIITNKKIGIILTQSNLNYIDVDFYIMDTNFLNYAIINQQISLKKEVMIKATDESEFPILKNFFNDSLKTPYDIKSYLQLQFITNVPNIFYDTFSEQLNLLPQLN